MAKDMDIIKELEKKFDKKLEKKFGGRLEQLDFDEVIGITRGYAIDENEHIIGLNLRRLGISDISILKDLTNLAYLHLSNNKILDISTLKNLTNLTELYLWENQISDITDLKKLTNLNYLSLEGNQITDISALQNLTNLIHLSLGNNQITDISALKYLTNLTLLKLSDNQITDISIIKNLTNLTLLDLRNNKTSHLPADIVNWTMKIKWQYDSKRGISLGGNPLEKPPTEIVKQGTEAVRAYFKSLGGEKKALNEVKVLLVGDGGVGKTSLMKRLLGMNFNVNEFQTHGININNWVVKPGKEKIKVNLWDFGGQEIMHATHQFFLSKRSLYVLVLDGRRDEKTEYWLKHIKSFGGDSPVLVVINKIDQNPGFDVNRLFLQGKYKNIKGFFRVSCATGVGIKNFSQNLIRELAKVEMLRTTWASSWFNIKTQLERMTEDFINYEEYKTLCEKENITDKTGQDTLVDYLNDLGVILHFKDFKLQETHVLNPEWVTTAVYKIINSEKLAGTHGILKLNLLDGILKKKRKDDYHYPRDKYRYIIDLMKKFELCFEMNDETILIPDLLEVQEPSFDFDYSTALKFRVDYDFLPRSVMPRFIVRMHNDIKTGLDWRTGVVLEDKTYGCIAVVKSDNDVGRIYIYVQGGQKRDYFSTIRKTLKDINTSFEKLEVEEKVPLPGNEEKSVTYKELVGLEQMGMEEIIIGEIRKKYTIKLLLNGIEKEDERINTGKELSIKNEVAVLPPKIPQESQPEERKKKWYNKTWVKAVVIIILLNIIWIICWLIWG